MISYTRTQEFLSNIQPLINRLPRNIHLHNIESVLFWIDELTSEYPSDSIDPGCEICGRLATSIVCEEILVEKGAIWSLDRYEVGSMRARCEKHPLLELTDPHGHLERSRNREG